VKSTFTYAADVSEIVVTPPCKKMVRFSFHTPIKVPLNKGEQHQAAWQFESES